MKRIARWLRWLADWLDSPSNVLLDRTRQLVCEAEMNYPVTYGEAKRHAVYSRLLKEFPEIPRRQIGGVIEQVVSTL